MRFPPLIKSIISPVWFFMIISHVSIIMKRIKVYCSIFVGHLGYFFLYSKYNKHMEKWFAALASVDRRWQRTSYNGRPNDGMLISIFFQEARISLRTEPAISNTRERVFILSFLNTRDKLVKKARLRLVFHQPAVSVWEIRGRTLTRVWLTIT